MLNVECWTKLGPPRPSWAQRSPPMPRVLRGVASHLRAAERPAAAVSVDAEPAHVLRSLDGAHRTANIEVTEPGAHPHSGISTRANTPVPAVNSFGVSTVLPGYGILPKKVRTTAEALECVNRDGAVILTGLGTSDPTGAESFKDTALELPAQIFGDGLLAMAPPVSVGIGNKPDTKEHKQYLRENWGKPVGPIMPWGPNCAHTDGEAYGDRYPSHLFLLFAHQSDQGGENAIVNSQYVIEEMARSGDPHLVRTAEMLKTVPVDQTALDWYGGRCRGYPLRLPDRADPPLRRDDGQDRDLLPAPSHSRAEDRSEDRTAHGLRDRNGRREHGGARQLG